MAEVGVTDFRSGMKLEIDGEPYSIVKADFIKPGKGQPFSRVKIKNLLNGRVIEKTYKSGEKMLLADVVETKMRMLYKEADDVVFMNDNSYEQMTIPNKNVEDVNDWLMEDVLYDIVFYKNEPISVVPPTFMDLKITETEPGARGDTSGRVLKPAKVESGATVQVPIFIEKGEEIKVDTRTGEYVSRSTK